MMEDRVSRLLATVLNEISKKIAGPEGRGDIDDLTLGEMLDDEDGEEVTDDGERDLGQTSGPTDGE